MSAPAVVSVCRNCGDLNPEGGIDTPKISNRQIGHGRPPAFVSRWGETLHALCGAFSGLRLFAHWRLP